MALDWRIERVRIMTRVHELKITKDYADSVYCGDKTFELRYNDRGYQKGDIVRFFTIDHDKKELKDHPLYKKEYEITYVINHGFGLDKAWVAFAIKPIEESEVAE